MRASAAPIEAHIAPFAQNRVAAISYTFDDGMHSQLELAVPMLETDGFHGTFFVIPSRIPDTEAERAAQNMTGWGSISWETLRELSARGHEIGNHTWSHPNLTTMNDFDVRDQIEHADRVITEKLGIVPLTVCYPGNGFNDKIKAIALEHHVADRESLTGFGGPEFTHAWAIKWVDDLIASRSWGVTMIHGIGAKPDETDPQILKAQMDYVKSRRDAVWVETFSTVARYVKERDAATLSISPLSAHKLSISLKCALDRAPYDVPLTVVVSAPGVRKANAHHNINSQSIITTVSKDQVQFDVTPGSDPVIVDWK